MALYYSRCIIGGNELDFLKKWVEVNKKNLGKSSAHRGESDCGCFSVWLEYEVWIRSSKKSDWGHVLKAFVWLLKRLDLLSR